MTNTSHPEWLDRALRKKRARSRRFAAVAGPIGASLVTASSFAQETYPARPLRLVVGFTPGGTTDMVA